jgi:hypothetical protein
MYPLNDASLAQEQFYFRIDANPQNSSVEETNIMVAIREILKTVAEASIKINHELELNKPMPILDNLARVTDGNTVKVVKHQPG